MIHTSCPHELWTYCVMYSCDILNHTASKTLEWRIPIEVAFGITPDISALVQFSFYEPIYYYASDPFPTTKELPGRFLGVAKNVGDALTFWVFTASNQVIARSVLREAVPWIDLGDTIDPKGARDDGELGIQVRKKMKLEEDALAKKLQMIFKPLLRNMMKPTSLMLPNSIYTITMGKIWNLLILKNSQMNIRKIKNPTNLSPSKLVWT